MEDSDMIRIGANYPFESSVQVQQNLAENLESKETVFFLDLSLQSFKMYFIDSLQPRL